MHDTESNVTNGSTISELRGTWFTEKLPSVRGGVGGGGAAWRHARGVGAARGGVFRRVDRGGARRVARSDGVLGAAPGNGHGNGHGAGTSDWEGSSHRRCLFLA